MTYYKELVEQRLESSCTSPPRDLEEPWKQSNKLPLNLISQNQTANLHRNIIALILRHRRSSIVHGNDHRSPGLDAGPAHHGIFLLKIRICKVAIKCKIRGRMRDRVGGVFLTLAARNKRYAGEIWRSDTDAVGVRGRTFIVECEHRIGYRWGIYDGWGTHEKSGS